MTRFFDEDEEVTHPYKSTMWMQCYADLARD